MTTGDVVTKSALIQKGFKQIEWFAGYAVYKRFNQKSVNYEYIFLNYWTKEIVNILVSEQ